MSKDRSYSTAIHILTSLAYHSPDLVSSQSLATGLKTNPGLIRRMLIKLSDAGLVESIKGKGGGNRLGKSASKISLGDVYLAVKDAPLFGSFDKEPFQKCPVSCGMGDALSEVYKGFENNLLKNMNEVKISSILRKVK